MLRSTSFTFALVLAGSLGVAGAAGAASLPNPGFLADLTTAASQGLAQKVHGCHQHGEYSWVKEWGDKAYHRHVGPYCKPAPAGQHPSGPRHDDHRKGHHDDHKKGRHDDHKKGHHDDHKKGRHDDHKKGHHDDHKKGHHDEHKKGHRDHKKDHHGRKPCIYIGGIKICP